MHVCIYGGKYITVHFLQYWRQHNSFLHSEQKYNNLVSLALIFADISPENIENFASFIRSLDLKPVNDCRSMNTS